MSNKVTTLNNEPKSTKAVYNKALITLTKKVKKLEKKLKHKRRRAVVDSSEDEEASLDKDDSLKQGRMIEEKDDDEITLAETLVNIKKSAEKDKGKAIMQESEPSKKIKKKEMIHISLDEEIAQRFYEEEQAHLLMDEEYAQQVQAQWVSDEARTAQENLSQAEQWDDVQAHIQADEDLAQRMLEEEREKIKMLFDRTMKSIRKFVPMENEGQISDSKAGKGSSKKGERLKRPAKEELGQELQMKQKVKEDLSQERLQQMMVIILEQGIHVEALQTNLVKERFNSSDPTKDKEIALWVELKRLLEPDEDDELWKFESFELIWRLYDWCGVHHISTRDGQDIFMLVEKERTPKKDLHTCRKTKKVKCLEEFSKYRRFNSRNLKI
nr:hypothetical protein [Tanacetum cinerariifolium]